MAHRMTCSARVQVRYSVLSQSVRMVGTLYIWQNESERRRARAVSLLPIRPPRRMHKLAVAEAGKSHLRDP